MSVAGDQRGFFKRDTPVAPRGSVSEFLWNSKTRVESRGSLDPLRFPISEPISNPIAAVVQQPAPGNPINPPPRRRRGEPRDLFSCGQGRGSSARRHARCHSREFNLPSGVESAASSGSAHGPLSRIATPKRRGAPSSYAGSYAFSLSLSLYLHPFSLLVTLVEKTSFMPAKTLCRSPLRKVSSQLRAAYFYNYILCALKDVPRDALFTHAPRNALPSAAIKQLYGKVKSRQREDTPGWRGDRKERTSRHRHAIENRPRFRNGRFHGGC